MSDWKAYLAAALAVLGMLFGMGRWVGRVDNRLDQLEQKDRYVHGTFTVPQER